MNTSFVRFLTVTILIAVMQSHNASAQDQTPVTSKRNPPMISAWVIDIPSAARVTGIDGVIVIMNRKEKKYELLELGREIYHEDIIRMMSEAALEVIYEDDSKGLFDYKDYPENSSGRGKWLIFKIINESINDKSQ